MTTLKDIHDHCRLVGLPSIHLDLKQGDLVKIILNLNETLDRRLHDNALGRDQPQPVASFLLSGPPASGKTRAVHEFGKALKLPVYTIGLGVLYAEDMVREEVLETGGQVGPDNAAIVVFDDIGGYHRRPDTKNIINQAVMTGTVNGQDAGLQNCFVFATTTQKPDEALVDLHACAGDQMMRYLRRCPAGKHANLGFDAIIKLDPR